MGFIKTGDDMPIGGYVDAEGEKQICPKCRKPFTVLAFDEDDKVELVCTCTDPNVLETVDE